MNIALNPEVLRARVDHLASVVDDLSDLSDRMRTAGFDQRGAWSELTTVSRVASPLATATYGLAGGVDGMLRSTENVRQALLDAAALLETTDENLMEDLESLGRDIENAQSARSGGGPLGGPYPTLA